MDSDMDTLFGAVVSSSKQSPRPQIIALVGGGGKTTLAFALASQAAGVGGLRVVVTTTTKMMLPRFSNIKCGAVEVDDCPVVLGSDAAAIEAVDSLFSTGSESEQGSDGGACGAKKPKKTGFVFVAAAIDPSPKYKGRRCLGVDASFPMALIEAGACDLVVVEADGSRKLPFKVPAAHEPVLPNGVSTVIAVAGLDVLGQPLDEEHVCRADVVSEVCDVPLGATVTEQVVAAALFNPLTWKVPFWQKSSSSTHQNAPTYFVCLNKADRDERMRAGRVISFSIRSLARAQGRLPAEIQRTVLLTGHFGELKRTQAVFDEFVPAQTANSNSAYSVRPGREADADAVVRLQIALAAETENGLKLNPELVRAGVLKGLLSPGAAAGELQPRYWVAECIETGDIVGCVGVSPEWSDWWNVAYWWIISIFVSADQRRRGVATRMLDTLLTAADAENVQTVNLRVEATNTAAQAFYKRQGFVHDPSHLVMSRGRRPNGEPVVDDNQ